MVGSGNDLKHKVHFGGQKDSNFGPALPRLGQLICFLLDQQHRDESLAGPCTSVCEAVQTFPRVLGCTCDFSIWKVTDRVGFFLPLCSSPVSRKATICTMQTTLAFNRQYICDVPTDDCIITPEMATALLCYVLHQTFFSITTQCCEGHGVKRRDQRFVWLTFLFLASSKSSCWYKRARRTFTGATGGASCMLEVSVYCILFFLLQRMSQPHPHI